MFKALNRLSKASIGLGASLVMRFVLPVLGGFLCMSFLRLGHPRDEENNALMIPVAYFVFIGLNHMKYVTSLDIPLQCSEHPRPTRVAANYLFADAILHFATAIPFLIVGFILSSSTFTTAAIVAGLASLCVYAGLHWYMKEFPIDELFSRFRRGRPLRSMADAAKRALPLTTAGERSFFWGGVRLPVSCLGSHFCLVGTSGSGKTTLIRLLMQDVLPPIATESDHRAIVYDAKRDMVSVLAGLDTGVMPTIANPFDARCHAWAIHEDITTPADAIQFAATLVPSEPGPNQYFNDAAIELVTGVITAFFLNGAPWSLRDIVCATRTKRSLRMVLLSRRETAHLVERHFEVETVVSNVLTTISSKLARFEPIAALWHATTQRSPGRTFSITAWSQGNGILVLGSDDKRKETMDAVNRVLLRRAVETTLSAQDSKTRRSWFFLDELGEAGRLDGIDSLLVRGRSKGAVAVIGIQDIDSIARPNLYGQHVANVLVNQCGNKALLRLEGHTTAKWAAETIGEAEAKERSRSSRPSKPEEDSFSEQVTKRESVLPSEFFELPVPSFSNGLFSGYFLSTHIGAWKGTFEAFPMLKNPGAVANHEDRPPREQYVSEWDKGDLDRLGLKPTEPDGPVQAGPSDPQVPIAPMDSLPRLTLPRN